MTDTGTIPHGLKGASGRLSTLDGLRGIAAVIVGLIFHARILYGANSDPFAGVPGLAWFQDYGWALVDLFFVLSGFVFAHCYLEGSKLRPDVTVRGFMVARIARLWPLHVATLAFAVLVLREMPSTTAENIALSAVFAHVFIDNPTEVLNGPAWSLSVEAICYLLFVLAALLGGRWLWITTFAAITLGIASIAMFGVWEALIGRGLAGFFIGVTLCRSHDLCSKIPSWVLVAGLLVPFVLPPAGNGLIATVLIAWPAAVLLALRTRILAARAFTWLGDRSYAIYLVHAPTYFVAKSILGPAISDSRLTALLALAACWIVILAVSNTLYNSLERPAQKAILKAFRDRQPSGFTRKSISP